MRLQSMKPIPAAGHPNGPMVAAGDMAPDFSCNNADGESFTLSNLRGQWVVLYFYPEDHTIGCTVEAKRFRDYFEAISIHRAAIIGVSRDNAGNHCQFRDNNQIPFELLCDEDAEVHDLFGAWKRRLIRRNQVSPRRCTFIIDPQGRVAKVYPKVAILSHAQDVVRDLDELVRLRKG